MNENEAYNESIAFITSLFTKKRAIRHTAEQGMTKVLKILNHLDNPQEKLAIIHLAGTSGKGSTAFAINALLLAHGFSVGLHLSPHIEDIRERFKINNTFISYEQFTKTVTKIRRSISFLAETIEAPTYYEFLVIMAFVVFHDVGVNFAVIETGVGGLFDSTNVVTNLSKICVITRIGHDHTKLLGTTLAAIALQKAGIIQMHNTVITIQQHKNAQDVLEGEAKSKQAKLITISRNKIKNITFSHNRLLFSFSFSFESIVYKKLSMQPIGTFQIENILLALMAFKEVSERYNFDVQEKLVRNTLASIIVPYRFEKKIYAEHETIFDGAHNPLEIRTLIKSLKVIYPKREFIFYFACTKGADYKKMVKSLVSIAGMIILTEFSFTNAGLQVASENPKNITKFLKELHFTQTKTVLCKEIKNDIKDIPQEAIIVITGSFFLLNSIQK
jgi:dihydrofolate synthase/folylpolyglutamate synthase